jgi:hypothetical protein
MEKAFALRQDPRGARLKSAIVTVYPAVADSVDLPDFSFCKNADEDVFVLLTAPRQQSFLKKNANLTDRIMAFDNIYIKTLLAPVCPASENFNIAFHISGRREAVLKITKDGKNIIIEAHWNLFIPYFDQIKALPIVHSGILDVFAGAVFHYAALAIKHPKAAKNELRNLVIDEYRAHPELLLSSLDIFNKPNIYHIRPTRVWLNRISAANDRYRLQIDISEASASPLVSPAFLEEIADFIHKVVKNYAFRYVDYLWMQKYKMTVGDASRTNIVAFADKEIVLNIYPLINQSDWKPAVYLNIGYAIMLAILQSSGKEHDTKETIYLAAMKTWHRYLSYDDSSEKPCVHQLFSMPPASGEEQCCRMMACTTGQNDPELIDDFVMLLSYSSQETFLERLNVLKDSRYEKKTGVYCEQLWNNVRNLNTSLVRDNINYSNLIEILRNDNIDHHQLKELLRTGHLNGRHVVDVSEWLLLRTLLYDLINTPKVFRNDYKMLLKVLTKVNKSLIAYIWTLGVDHDPRFEIVSAYISKLMSDIFVFNRVKIYEIIADPSECLESEAVTGYLLNWTGLTPEERRFVIEKIVSKLPQHLVEQLIIETADDVGQLLRIMSIRSSGLFGFYLHQAYRWGSTQDPLTERIRASFPELLKQAQGAILPTTRVMGGAMLLLLLAQIISDERDGFAGNIVITEEERQIVRDLIKQCIHWDQMHFVIMIAGIAAGYMGSIDGWVLQQFDSLLGRYDAGDRVVLRSVVQFDIDNLIERALITTKNGEENTLLNKLQLLRFGVDPVVSDQANKFLRTTACRHGIYLPEDALRKKDIREPVLAIYRHIKT